MLEVDGQSGGFTPWNEIAVFSSMIRGMINLPSEASIVQQDGTI